MGSLAAGSSLGRGEQGTAAARLRSLGHRVRDRSDPRLQPELCRHSRLVRPADAASDSIRIEQFGLSPEGRPIYAVIASKDGAAFDPNKPVLMIQAGIHPGEIDGKDAGMMLLRDIAFYGKDAPIDRVNLILIPILSVDGHERHRPIPAQPTRTAHPGLAQHRDQPEPQPRLSEA